MRNHLLDEKIYLILAGNYQQAKECVRSIEKEQGRFIRWKYIKEPADYFGFEDGEVILYGGFWLNKLFEDKNF